MTDKPTPTDAELKAMWQLHAADIGGIFCYARAVLAKWGQPPQAAEPVAWLDPWAGTKVTTDYDAYGKHGIPLYTAPQPTQAQSGAVPMSHEAAKALVRKYGKDPLHLVLQVERHHGIKGGQHG